MFKGNTGLLALCALLAAAAFAVVFVAPRYMEGEETPPPEVVAEARDAAGPVEGPDAGDSVTAEAEPEEESSPPDASSEQAAAPAVKTPDDASDASDQPAAPEEETAAASPQAEDEEVVPAFDVLRVEPDGSMVVAGRAEPGSTVEIVNGEDVLASTEAGPAGNFAAVLDEPLAPGDYQIALRASGKDGASKRSDEVATVSVPRSDDDELLALVTRPGEASRIVTAPDAEAPATEGAGETSGNAEETDDAAPAADTGAAEAVEDEPAAESEGPDGTAGTEETTVTASREDRLPDAGEEAADTLTDGEVGETAALGETEAPDEAASDPDAAKGDRPLADTVENVRIDAVEVESDHLFVTGSAEPGATVGIYVDNVLAGSDEVSEEGRFLVEERMPLAVGEHMIRADMTVDGEVIARAIVPFTRPDEDTAAAVARLAPTESGDAASAPPVTAPPSDDGSAAETAEERPADDETAPADTAAGGEEATDTAAAEDDASSPAAEPEAPELATRDEADEAEPSFPPATGEGGDEAIVTLRQQPLEPTDASVIIRRGDTLWEISRRVYGRGVRYTTIYLANDDQIANPDLILPGQIFTVPEESLENSEELHRRRMLGLDG